MEPSACARVGPPGERRVPQCRAARPLGAHALARRLGAAAQPPAFAQRPASGQLHAARDARDMRKGQQIGASAQRQLRDAQLVNGRRHSASQVGLQRGPQAGVRALCTRRRHQPLEARARLHTQRRPAVELLTSAHRCGRHSPVSAAGPERGHSPTRPARPLPPRRPA